MPLCDAVRRLLALAARHPATLPPRGAGYRPRPSGADHPAPPVPPAGGAGVSRAADAPRFATGGLLRSNAGPVYDLRVVWRSARQVRALHHYDTRLPERITLGPDTWRDLCADASALLHVDQEVSSIDAALWRFDTIPVALDRWLPPGEVRLTWPAESLRLAEPETRHWLPGLADGDDGPDVGTCGTCAGPVSSYTRVEAPLDAPADRPTPPRPFTARPCGHVQPAPLHLRVGDNPTPKVPFHEVPGDRWTKP